MLKDVKYSKEVANDIILKIKSENKIIPSLKRTIELLSSLESSEEIAKEIMEKIKNEKGVVPTLENTSGYMEYERVELRRRFELKKSKTLQKNMQILK